MLGLSEVYVRKIEKAHCNPGRKTMIKFEKLYGVSSRELFPDLFDVIIDTKCINKRSQGDDSNVRNQAG